MIHEPGTRVIYIGDKEAIINALPSVFSHAIGIRDNQKKHVSIGRFSRTLEAQNIDYVCTYTGNQTTLTIISPSEVLAEKKRKREEKHKNLRVGVFLFLTLEKSKYRAFLYNRLPNTPIPDYFVYYENYVDLIPVIACCEWDYVAQKIVTNSITAKVLSEKEYKDLMYVSTYGGIWEGSDVKKRYDVLASYFPSLGLPACDLDDRAVEQYKNIAASGGGTQRGRVSELCKRVPPYLNNSYILEPVLGAALSGTSESSAAPYDKSFCSMPMASNHGFEYGDFYYGTTGPSGGYPFSNYTSLDIGTPDNLILDDLNDSINWSLNPMVRQYPDSTVSSTMAGYFEQSSWIENPGDITEQIVTQYTNAKFFWTSRFGDMFNGTVLTSTMNAQSDIKSSDWTASAHPRYAFYVAHGPRTSDDSSAITSVIREPSWLNQAVGFDATAIFSNVLYGYAPYPLSTDQVPVMSFLNLRGFCDFPKTDSWSTQPASDTFADMAKQLFELAVTTGGANTLLPQDLPSELFSGLPGKPIVDFRADPGLAICDRNLRRVEFCCVPFSNTKTTSVEEVL